MRNHIVSPQCVRRIINVSVVNVVAGIHCRVAGVQIINSTHESVLTHGIVGHLCNFVSDAVNGVPPVG